MKLKTYTPNHLPLRLLDWQAFDHLLGKAHAAIARYDEVITSVQEPEKIFSILTSSEALVSMQSHQGSLTLQDLLFCNALGAKAANQDHLEAFRILNYRSSLINAARHVSTHPISFELLCKLHAAIKRGPKNASKEMKKFRTHQNWIGPEGCSIEEAYFYPPSVKMMNKSMHNLKQYLSYQEKDPLVQLAIFFAQLLIIHPFMDGNGRVARALIPLVLYKKKLLSAPMFYLSAYFKKHRLKYFEKLYTITSDGNWESWIHFFLKGIIEDGSSELQKAKKILALYHQLSEEAGDSKDAQEMVCALFTSGILNLEKWDQKKESLRVLRRLEEKKYIIFYKTKSMVAVKGLLSIDSL